MISGLYFDPVLFIFFNFYLFASSVMHFDPTQAYKAPLSNKHFVCVCVYKILPMTIQS